MIREQANHESVNFIKKEFPVVIVCDGVQSPANIGALFRLSDSFGISKIYFCSCDDFPVGSKRMEKTARNAHKVVPYATGDQTTAVLKNYQQKDYTILGLEITNDSVPIRDIKLDSKTKIVLVVGHEKSGISNPVLKLLDTAIHIPMYGLNSSMNVATATGITLYELTERFRNTLKHFVE